MEFIKIWTFLKTMIKESETPNFKTLDESVDFMVKVVRLLEGYLADKYNDENLVEFDDKTKQIGRFTDKQLFDIVMSFEIDRPLFADVMHAIIIEQGVIDTQD